MACGRPHLIHISALPFRALLLGLEGWRSLHCAMNQSPRLVQGTATLFRHMESSNQFAPKWITWKPTWMDLIWRHSGNQRKARSAKTLSWSFGRYSERMDPDSSNLACVVRAWQQMHARPILQLCHPLQCPIIYFDKYHIGTWQRCLLELFMTGYDVGSGPRDEYSIKWSPYTLQAEEKAPLLRGATTSSQCSGAIMTCAILRAPMHDEDIFYVFCNLEALYFFHSRWNASWKYPGLQLAARSGRLS